MSVGQYWPNRLTEMASGKPKRGRLASGIRLDRADPLHHRRLGMIEITILKCNYSHSAAGLGQQHLQEFSRSQQEVRIRGLTETTIALRKCFIDQHSARGQTG